MSIKKLEVGQTLWKVRVRLNTPRKKLKMVDKDGVTWYRYDKEFRDYSIVQWKIIGRIEYVIEGEIGTSGYEPDIPETLVHYSLESSEDGQEDFIDGYYEDEEYYLTWESAHERVVELKRRDHDISGA